MALSGCADPADGEGVYLGIAGQIPARDRLVSGSNPSLAISLTII